MNTKQTLIALAGLVIILIGVSFLFQSSVQEESSQTNDAQGKLNIQAVCEGALAYMSFPDAAAANVFVQECVEGKHPEVIERYKTDHGFDGATI